MAITFPASPSDGDVFTNSTTGVKYIYNATDGVWKTHVWPTNTDYLQLSGGTLTGDLSLGTNDLTAQDITTTGAVSVGTGLTVGSGLTVSDGNVVMADGHGIDFSATGDGSASMSNELFDDYEEGSWTPAVADTFQGISQASGKYVKIGRTVFVTYQFAYTGLDSTNTDSAISGLPYTVAEDNPGTGIGATGIAFGSNKRVTSYAEESTTWLKFDTDSPLFGSVSGGNDFFRGSITYNT